MIDLFSPIERNAAFAARKPALRFEGATLTYGDLVRRVRGAAAALHKAGVGEGDRVAVLAYNHPDTLTLLYACAKLGAVLTPLNWRLAEDELAYAIDHAQPKQLAHGAAFAELAQRFLPPDKLIPLEQPLALEGDGESPDRAAPEKPCLLVYTSGTTGRPKGALLSQAALVGNAIQSHHMHQMGASDHVLTVLPLFHVGGLNIQTTPALMAGATVTLTARFDPSETLRAIVDDRPTLTLLVPAAMQALAAMPGFEEANLSGLRALSTGSTIVPEALIETFERRGVPVLSVYGATETSPIAAYDRWGEPRVKGATGRAGLLSHIKIVGPDGARLPSGTHGEIAVRGPGLSAYFRDAEATAQTLREGYI
ncbi:MAG: AMP-binding protein, partial [Pseudomonadota bacterium]